MRLHLTCHGKKTTVSIDDQLIDFLGALMVIDEPKRHSQAKVQHKRATAFIRRHVKNIGNALPTKNISQYIQSFIIKEIAYPELKDIIKVRGDRYMKAEPDWNTIYPGFDQKVEKLKAQLSVSQEIGKP